MSFRRLPTSVHADTSYHALRRMGIIRHYAAAWMSPAFTQGNAARPPPYVHGIVPYHAYATHYPRNPPLSRMPFAVSPLRARQRRNDSAAPAAISATMPLLWAIFVTRTNMPLAPALSMRRTIRKITPCRHAGAASSPPPPKSPAAPRHACATSNAVTPPTTPRKEELFARKE